MKSFLIKNAIGMILSFIVMLDKDGSDVKKWKPLFTQLRDAILVVYPIDE